MWNTIVYVLAFAAALSVIAAGLDQVAARRGNRRRTVWLLAMLCSTLLPPLLIFSADTEPSVASIAAKTMLNQPDVVAPVNAIPAPRIAPASIARPATTLPPEPAGWHLAEPSSNSLLIAWAIASGGLLAFVIGAGLRLWRRTAGWQRALIQKQEVLVSEDTGPALLGVLRPQIVVPRWFMDEPAATQSLILEHERQHIAAHDPLLLRVAMLVAIVTPWNLLLWWQLHRLRLAIELDCDARVLRGGAEAGCYGKVLLEVTQRANAMPVGVIAMSEPVSALEKRIRSLVPRSGRYATLRMIGAFLIAAAGIGAAAALEAPAIQQTPKEPVRNNAPATGLPEAPVQTAAPQAIQPASIPSNPAPKGPAQSANSRLESNPALRETAIREAFARDAVMDDRQNKDGTPVDPLTYGKPICRVTRDGVTTSLLVGGTQFDLETLQALAKGCKPLNVFGTPGRAEVVDLDKIPSNLLQRMEVITGGASTTYGSGAMAGVVNLVLNNRLQGLKLDLDYGVNADQSMTRLATGAPAVTRAAAQGVSNFLVTIIPGESARAASPQVGVDQYVGEDTEVVTALITLQGPGLWNPQLFAKSLGLLLSPSGSLSETTDGDSLRVVDKLANVKRIAAQLQGQSARQ